VSPLHIEILLHYRGRADDFRDGDFSAPAVRDAINDFKGELGLLELEPAGSDFARTYRLTERGEVYVAALCALPLPTQRWVIP
jgi:hypothetical protein